MERDERFRKARICGLFDGTSDETGFYGNSGIHVISNLNSDTALSLDDMIGRADKALYLAKASGRNCVKFASDMKTAGKVGGSFAALSHS